MSLSEINQKHLAETPKFKMFASKGTTEAIAEVPNELLSGPSGASFGLSMLTSMGANPQDVVSRLSKQITLLSTFAGLRNEAGETISYGAHAGHDRLDLQMREAANIISTLGGQTRVAYTSGGCDGVWQGRPEMHYSLVSRNTMYQQMLVQLGVYPDSKGVLGFASCDKEAPATAAAIVHLKKLEDVYKKKLIGLVIPGGAMLPSDDPSIFDTGKVQVVNAMTNFGHMTREEAAKQLCHACTKTGGGCQFFGTAASMQSVIEALGLSIPHSACIPSSTEPWLKLASRSAEFLLALIDRGFGLSDLISQKSIHNAMVLMAASGASTNCFMHLAFIARAAGLKPPTIEEYKKVFSKVPRILRVLPNGPGHEQYPQYPKGFPTAMFWAAGGVPELFLNIRDLDILELDAMTATGLSLGNNLKNWESSERRKYYRAMLKDEVGIDPKHVIMSLDHGIPSAYTFPTGNICNISVCKSSSISSELLTDGIYHKIGTARVFTSEVKLRQSIRDKQIKSDDIICLVGRGFLGTGLEEIYEFTAQIAHIPELKKVAVLTDARFSGVTTGACIGHMIPEALAGGNCGKLLDGDIVEIRIDANAGVATVNLIGDVASGAKSYEYGSSLLEKRQLRQDMLAGNLPEAVKLQAVTMHALGEDWRSGYYADPEYLHRILVERGISLIPGY